MMTIILLSTILNASNTQENAKAFLKKNFPEYANDSEMIHLIADGEEEWV